MNRTRAAFTLTELLVALAVVLVIAGIAVVVVPGAVSQDRTTDAAASVRQHLMIAKNHAARDGLPRGIRFIVGLDPNTPAKTNELWVTQLQYIETPVLVLNTIPSANSFVRVEYTVDASGNRTNRQLFIKGLSFEQLTDLTYGGSLLSVPEFSDFWGRINGVVNAGTGEVTLDTASWTELDKYMGSSTSAVSYMFGVYPRPAPMVSQPNEVLPVNICVDLSMTTGPTSPPTYPYFIAPSRPQGRPGQDFDILFAPNGQVINRPGMPVAGGQIYLWVRDYTKAANPLVVISEIPNPNPMLPGTPVYDMTPFRGGGEQQIVALKTKSGAMGVFPVMWPDQATGTYATGQDPWTFALQGATGP